MEEIDEAFVQDAQFRPVPNEFKVDEVPVIDLSIQEPGDDERVKSQIRNACERWGFFQVINHGVPAEVRSNVEKQAREFFFQSLEEKRKVKRDAVNSMGFHDSEHTKNVRDWKEVFDYLLVDPTTIPASVDPDDQQLRTLSNQWPLHPIGFREACQEYANEMQKLAFRLLELVALTLGLPRDRLNGFFKEQLSLCRLNYYPPCPAPHLALGVGRHKDSGVLTVLSQDDVGGLQVCRKSDGAWLPVTPMPDALIVNIGNCVQVWSNDRYWSAEHRVVVNSKRERFSIPFFLFPSHNVQMRPLDELVSRERPAKYSDFNWGKFHASRNRSDFQKLEADNIQIDQFKAL